MDFVISQNSWRSNRTVTTPESASYSGSFLVMGPTAWSCWDFPAIKSDMRISVRPRNSEMENRYKLCTIANIINDILQIINRLKYKIFPTYRLAQNNPCQIPSSIIRLRLRCARRTALRNSSEDYMFLWWLGFVESFGSVHPCSLQGTDQFLLFIKWNFVYKGFHPKFIKLHVYHLKYFYIIYRID